MFSPGIPCLYYGTDQAFDGSGGRDIYIREAMFGGKFGAFRSMGRHFFNTSTVLYREIARLLEIRAGHICLRQGRTYHRDLLSGGGSGTGSRNGRYRGLIAWSRILSDIEVVVVINCSLRKKHKALVGIDDSLHENGDLFHCIYRSYSKPKQGDTAVRLKAGRKCIHVEVPAYGCSVYANRKLKK